MIVDDLKGFKENMKCTCSRDEMQSSTKEREFDRFDTYWYFDYILTYKHQIKMIIKPF